MMIRCGSMSGRRVLIKNAVLMTTSAPAGGVLNFIMTLLIARSLQSAGFGTYSLILSFIMFFQIFIEASRTPIIRDIVQAPERMPELFGTAKSLMWLLSFLCLLVLLATIFFVRSEARAWTFVLAAIGATAMFHALGYGIIFVATEKMEFNSIGSFVHKALALLLVYLALKVNNSLESTYTALIIANSALWAFYFRVFRTKWGKVSLIRNVQQISVLLKNVASTGATALLRRFRFNATVILLAAMTSASTVGIFSGAYSIIVSLNMIPWFSALAFFPMLSRIAHRDSRRLVNVTLWGVFGFLVVAGPCLLAAREFVNPLILFLLGKGYARSSAVMMVLIWDLALSFPISLLFYIFTALKIENKYLAASGTGLAINMIVAYSLIPAHGPIGAAIGVLCDDAVCFLSLLIMLGLQYRALKAPPSVELDANAPQSPYSPEPSKRQGRNSCFPR